MTLNLVLWLLIAAQALVLEGAGVFSRSDTWYPLTYYIRKYVPKAIIATALVWLAYHFGVQS